MKKQSVRSLLSLVLVLVMMSTLVTAAYAADWYCPKCGRKNTDNFCPKDGTSKPADLGTSYSGSSSGKKSSVRVGDVLKMGVYEQDNNRNNGKEPIEWLVLDVSGSSALVISRYGLEAKQPYHNRYAAVTWDNCALRSWLNGDFYQSAFSFSEQLSIQQTYVDNSVSQNNKEWKTPGGSNTYDRVFLLSCAEAEKYFCDNAARRCGATDYAIAQGAWTYDKYSPECRLSGAWWLRSPGPSQNYAACVDIPGGTKYHNSVGNEHVLVRPAMWISTN